MKPSGGVFAALFSGQLLLVAPSVDVHESDTSLVELLGDAPAQLLPREMSKVRPYRVVVMEFARALREDVSREMRRIGTAGLAIR